jgi:enoyl-CoA hydratase/carnithine racemase
VDQIVSSASKSIFFHLERSGSTVLLRLDTIDGTNRLTRQAVIGLTEALRQLSRKKQPLVITGSAHFFSAGADLNEIATLDGPRAYAFSKMGQELMAGIEHFPAPVYAAISGYCMGGGLDLALACHRRIVAPNAVFGHRGAALGLITGWGGTQRMPRLIGKARALEMLVCTEKVNATEALRIGLIDAIAADPVAESMRRIASIS